LKYRHKRNLRTVYRTLRFYKKVILNKSIKLEHDVPLRVLAVDVAPFKASAAALRTKALTRPKTQIPEAGAGAGTGAGTTAEE